MSVFNAVRAGFYSTPIDIIDGNWKHIVITRRNRDIKLYVNSVDTTINVIGTINGSNPIYIYSSTTWRSSDNGSGTGGGVGGNYNGDMSIIRLYKRQLTADEVERNFKLDKSKYLSPVLHWDAGNTSSYPGSGTTIQDLTTSNFDGTLIGPVYSSSQGGSFDFNNSENDWINSTGTDTGLGVVGTSDYTIEVWVKIDNINQRGIIFGNRNSQQGGQFTLFVGTNNTVSSATDSKKLSIIATSFNSVIYRVFSSVNDIVDGNWKHVVVTRTNQYTYRMYVNGVEQSLSLNQSGGVGIFNISNTYTWRSGDSGQSNGNDSFDGNLSIVRLHKRSILQYEIIENFDSEKSRYGL